MFKKLILTAIFTQSLLFAKAQESSKALADKLFARQEYLKAAAYYRKTLAGNDGDWKAWRSLGLCLLNLDLKKDEAKVAFLKAVHLNPNDGISCYHLGMLYRQAAAEAGKNDRQSELRTRSLQFLVKAAELGNADAKFELSNP